MNCIIEEMDLTKCSKPELLAKCEELGITKCKSKNKGELIELINSKTITKTTEENHIELIIEETNEKIKIDNENIVENEIGPYEREEKYLSDFLKTINNKNGTYKRICISPLRYAGGKSDDFRESLSGDRLYWQSAG